MKYIPAKLYGFLQDDADREAFFHLGVFHPGPEQEAHPQCSVCPRTGCLWSVSPPPPILGELVEVVIDFDQGTDRKAPRASRVDRLSPARAVRGMVDTFDVQRGYGFVVGDDGESYHLHRSELVENRIPVPGQVVMFYAGIRMSRPRACHVKVCITKRSS